MALRDKDFRAGERRFCLTKRAEIITAKEQISDRPGPGDGPGQWRLSWNW